MKKLIASALLPAFRRLGYEIVPYRKNHSGPSGFPADFSVRNAEICARVKEFTMTSPERINALIDAVHYVVTNDIGGAFVECGVWKGGSVMAIAMTLQNLVATDRELYLYDTFSGMTAPGDVDVSISGVKAQETFSKTKLSDDASEWCASPLDEVKKNVFGTGYPETKIRFIEGKVEETIPKTIPKAIALLRLDTDWYESTRHEMTHLYPLLQRHGVLIIDDYGHWKGSRKAIDEYFSTNNIRILLNRIDDTGRLAIKT